VFSFSKEDEFLFNPTVMNNQYPGTNDHGMTKAPIVIAAAAAALAIVELGNSLDIRAYSLVIA
jgi:hypothetical protein